MKAFEKPRVHWVSPLPDAQTDIAHYTQRILPELAAATNLTLWTDARGWDRKLEEYCPIHCLDPDHVLPSDFTQAGPGRGGDAIFVHIGNSWVFHAGFLRLVRRLPSIVVLHDLAIQELCFDAMHNRRFSKDIYKNEIERWYGGAGVSAANKVFDGQMKPIELSHTYPGFEVTLDRSVSVLTHTPAAFDAVKATGIAPAYGLELPFRPSEPRLPASRIKNGPLRFVQFGYIGPNRRLQQVLEALAPLKDSIDFRFDIMGNVWDRDFLMELLQKLKLSDRVFIHGFVPEPELDAALANAHLVFNLRYPTMGEASGSQLRIWNASAASVVTDLGWYGSLPENTVFKISREHETSDLQDLVRRLAADRSIGTHLGQRGRERLEAFHTPARYAEGIAEIAAQFSGDAVMSLKARRMRHIIGKMPGSKNLYQEALKKHI